jgi:hypothetical protein
MMNVCGNDVYLLCLNVCESVFWMMNVYGNDVYLLCLNVCENVLMNV